MFLMIPLALHNRWLRQSTQATDRFLWRFISLKIILCMTLFGNSFVHWCNYMYISLVNNKTEGAAKCFIRLAIISKWKTSSSARVEGWISPFVILDKSPGALTPSNCSDRKLRVHTYGILQPKSLTQNLVFEALQFGDFLRIFLMPCSVAEISSRSPQPMTSRQKRSSRSSPSPPRLAPVSPGWFLLLGLASRFLPWWCWG